MKAIVTKYHPPGAVRGPRYSATDGDWRVSIPVNPDWNDNHKQGHEAAARAFCIKLNWSGALVRGSVKDGEVWVFRQSGLNCADEIAVGCHVKEAA